VTLSLLRRASHDIWVRSVPIWELFARPIGRSGDGSPDPPFDYRNPSQCSMVLLCEVWNGPPDPPYLEPILYRRRCLLRGLSPIQASEAVIAAARLGRSLGTS